jgi:hypothetical protein
MRTTSSRFATRQYKDSLYPRDLTAEEMLRGADAAAGSRFATALPSIKLRDFHGKSDGLIRLFNASTLERGLPGSHRVDHHPDGLDNDRGIVDHDVVSRFRLVDVHCPRHERRELVLRR